MKCIEFKAKLIVKEPIKLKKISSFWYNNKNYILEDGHQRLIHFHEFIR